MGTRTDNFEQTVGFFRDVLGVPLEMLGADFAWSRMANTSQLEVFGPADDEDGHFTTGPVPEFLVDDLPAGRSVNTVQSWRRRHADFPSLSPGLPRAPSGTGVA